MKILTAISLISSLLTPLNTKPIKNDRVLVGTGNNSMIDVSYTYGVEYVGLNTSTATQSTTGTNYYCDMQVNINGSYSGTVRINYTEPNNSLVTVPSTYKINYVIFGCNATSTTVHNDYINVRIPDGAQSFNVRFYFNETQVTYYGLSVSASNITELNWINQGISNTYFEPLSVSNSLVAIQNADDYEIDYTSILNGSLYDNDGNGICYYLDDIAIKSENIYAELIAIHQDLIASINSLKTLSLAEVPEYSWSIYYLFKRKWTLKYDSTFPRPYVTTTDDSSTTFDWNDAIQIQDRDLYIVLATYNDSSSTLPVKIIKSNNTDVSSQLTWTYRYTGRYRFYYTRIPSDLFNNALNIKWTRAVNVMPVYLGRLNNMPLEVAEICNIDSNNQLIRELEKINNSINGLDDVTVDTNDKNAVDTEYNSNLQELNQTIQGITLPSMTNKDKGMFNYLTGFYMDIINNDSMKLYKYGIIITIISAVIKVIL